MKSKRVGKRTLFPVKRELADPHDLLIEAMKSCLFDIEKSNLQSIEKDFESDLQDFQEIKKKFQSKIMQMPLFVAIYLWSKSAVKGFITDYYLKIMQDLIVNGIVKIGLTSYPLTLQHIGSEIEGDWMPTVDRIRCDDRFPIEKREEYVEVYLNFLTWLSEKTDGYVWKPVDYDRWITERKMMPFDIYIKFLKELSERERVLAKLFYLGGTRTIEEVFSLKIENIDFQENEIKFGQFKIRYPDHVLKDLYKFVNGRKTGFVFSSKKGERLDPSVPYRCLQTVAKKINHPNITFRDFVIDG